MNERIRLLAEQAGITTNLDTDFFEKNSNKWVDYYSEKFAELIIQECLVAIENTNLHHAHTTFDHNLIMATITKSKEAVKQHFGM